MRVSTIICGWFILMVGLLLAGNVNAQEPTVTPTPTPAPDCAECHLDVVASWQNSTHAQAYHDPAFQTAWQSKGSDPMCLACHTTGFSARTGTFDLPGVGCATCHGETPANHPPEAITVNQSAEMCADCHQTTFAEWQMSLHGEQQLACATCHTPHDQHLRFATVNELCLNCHTEARDDYAHVSHPEQTCVDCHWYQSLDETAHITTGDLMPTGHDSQVETHTCVDCHTTLAQEGQVIEIALISESPLLEAQVQIDELEAEVKTAEAEGENHAAVRLIMGLVVGSLITGAGFRGYLSLIRGI